MKANTATFTATTNIYSINTESSKNDLRDQLHAKIFHARAMLTMLVSDGGLENFLHLGTELQGDYLWAVCMAIDEAKDLINNM